MRGTPTTSPDRGRRHAGILAHSAEGSALCYLTFCRTGFAELGPHDHPDVTLDFIPLARSLPAWERDDRAAVRAVLAESVSRLAGAGAEFFVCPDNTAHLALELGGPPLALPGLHLPDVVAHQAADAGHRRIGVLGTRWTMDSSLYADAFGRQGLEAVSPEPVDRALVDEVIFSELLNGRIRAESRKGIVEAIDRLAGRGCDAVALVCTEIPLLVTPDASPLPTLDSTRLAARAAFEVAVGTRPMPSWRGGPPAPSSGQSVRAAEAGTTGHEPS
jgi:aspartate racemase